MFLAAHNGSATGTNGFQLIKNFVGNNTQTTLRGSDLDSVWNITANNAGNIVNAGGTTTFTGVSNIVGGLLPDRFVFSDGVTISGTIDDLGSGGFFDYSNYTTPIVIDLENNSATNIFSGAAGGIGIVTQIIGSSAIDTLIARNIANSWRILSDNSGDINLGTPFSSMENLVGGTANDFFRIFDGVNVSGTVDGAGGTNTLSFFFKHPYCS